MAAAQSTIPLGVPRVSIAGEGFAVARIFGFIADDWKESDGVPPASERVEKFITRLPFAIGAGPCRR